MRFSKNSSACGVGGAGPAAAPSAVHKSIKAIVPELSVTMYAPPASPSTPPKKLLYPTGRGGPEQSFAEGGKRAPLGAARRSVDSLLGRGALSRLRGAH